MRQLLITILLLSALVLSPLTPQRISAQGQSKLPSAQAIDLVNTIYGDNVEDAQKATVELLRLAGLPVVSQAGPIVTKPDHLILAEAAIYSELIPTLTARVRSDTTFTVQQLATLITGFGITKKDIPPEGLIGAFSEWGKDADDPVEAQVAGAAVRALASHRGEVFYPGVDVKSVDVDPLSMILLIAHLAVPAHEVRQAALNPIDVYAKPRLDTDPCSSLNEVVNSDNPIVIKLKEKLTEKILSYLPEAVQNGIGFASSVLDPAVKGLNLLLVYLGAQLDLTPDKDVTEFKTHSGGPQDDKNIKLTATAKFDSTLAQSKLACYALAGINVPSNGPMGNYRIRWRMIGDLLGAYSPEDSKRLGDCGDCGELTSEETGQSILTVQPPRYLDDGTENQGKEHKGYVTIRASLDKDAEIPFSAADLLGALDPMGSAVSKTIDTVLEALQRMSYPTVGEVITVKYHGAKAYSMKANMNAWMLFVTVPVQVDLYSCDGISGPYTGKAGIPAVKGTDFGQMASAVAGKPLPTGFQAMNDHVSFSLPDHPQTSAEYPVVFNELLTGKVVFDKVPSDPQIDQIGPVGTLELDLGKTPLADICDLTGSCNAKVRIIAESQDERCPGMGAHWYAFDSNNK